MCVYIYNVCKHRHTDDRSDSDHGDDGELPRMKIPLLMLL